MISFSIPVHSTRVWLRIRTGFEAGRVEKTRAPNELLALYNEFYRKNIRE